MFQQQYYVPKSTGTLSDLLLAFGAAEVLRQFVQQHAPHAQVMLMDAGSCFVVDTGVPLEEAWLATTEPFEPIRFLAGNKTTPPDDLPLMGARNVDEEWERFHQYNEQRKQLGEKGLVGDDLAQQLADLAPAPDWTVATYLGDYRMQAQDIHNSLVERWLRSSQLLLPQTLCSFLALFAGLDADWDAIADDWKKAAKAVDLPDSVTASQLFSPYASKGQNRTKANKLTMGNEKAFWLIEYLKAVGLWAATAPTKATNADLRKTYVLAPHRIDMAFHQRVFDEFRSRLWNTGAVKLDILAALLYAEVLLERCIEDNQLAFFDDGPISNVVTGMGVATYQLLSANSYTLMNLAFLGLPDWMPHVQSRDDATAYIAILREHHERVRAIDDDTSEGYALLQLYRDFVSGNYLEPFFEFCAGYSSYLMSALDRSQFYVKPFSETNLRSLFTMIDEKSFGHIVRNEGFRNIAYAIRHSTVIPQGRKARKLPLIVEIRYGLGQELVRKSAYPDDFLAAVAEFIHLYNAENAQLRERNREPYRKNVTSTDIDKFVDLVDQFGANVVCNLLVAYGYARDPRARDDESAMAEDGGAIDESAVAEGDTVALPDVTLPDAAQPDVND